MPMQPPKPTVPTSLPMYFMVSNSAKHGTTCNASRLVRDIYRSAVIQLSASLQAATFHLLRTLESHCHLFYRLKVE